MRRVVLFYKHFARVAPGVSHVGLGNNAFLTARVLKTAGVPAEPVPVVTPADITAALAARPGVTHAVVEAVWLTGQELATLAAQHPQVEWVCREHSQLAFLSCEPAAIAKVRDYGRVAESALNFAVAGNSPRFSRFFEEAYSTPCLTLPNLYPADAHARRRVRRSQHRDTLRVSAFGATRHLKNMTTAAGAALMIGRRLGRDVELHVNVGRERGLDGVVAAVRAVVAGVPGARLVEHPWAAWCDFRHWCAQMDLGLCPSFTETFCLTAADHVSAGVPVVGSDAVDWLPRHWQARADDAEDVARVGCGLLVDPFAGADGLEALARHQADALAAWRRWLGV